MRIINGIFSSLENITKKQLIYTENNPCLYLFRKSKSILIIDIIESNKGMLRKS